MTWGLDVLVQLVMAAMATCPWSSSKDCPSAAVTGTRREGRSVLRTATDLVLTITEMMRKHGVVGKFVEFYGDGVASVPLANRATIGNMSPEFGSTAAISGGSGPELPMHVVQPKPTRLKPSLSR